MAHGLEKSTCQGVGSSQMDSSRGTHVWLSGNWNPQLSRAASLILSLLPVYKAQEVCSLIETSGKLFVQKKIQQVLAKIYENVSENAEATVCG